MLNLIHLRNSLEISENEQRRALAIKDFLKVSQLTLYLQSLLVEFIIHSKLIRKKKHVYTESFSLKVKYRLFPYYIIETHLMSTGATDFHRKRNQMTLLKL